MSKEPFHIPTAAELRDGLRTRITELEAEVKSARYASQLFEQSAKDLAAELKSAEAEVERLTNLAQLRADELIHIAVENKRLKQYEPDWEQMSRIRDDIAAGNLGQTPAEVLGELDGERIAALEADNKRLREELELYKEKAHER